MVNKVSNSDSLDHSNVYLVFLLFIGYLYFSVVAMIYFYLVMTGIWSIKIILTMGGQIPVKSYTLAFLSAVFDGLLLFYFAGMVVSQL